MKTEKLRERRRRLARGLPPLEEVLRGSVVRRVVRCGKAGCRCADGDGHPAVYLSVTLRGGRTEQISLPEQLVEQVERQVGNYRALWDAIEKISAINRDLLRALRESARSSRRGRSSQ
jgi:hypothetical protein